MNWAGVDDLLAGLVAGFTEVGPQRLPEGFPQLFHVPDLELDLLDVFTVCLHGAVEGSHMAVATILMESSYLCWLIIALDLMAGMVDQGRLSSLGSTLVYCLWVRLCRRGSRLAVPRQAQVLVFKGRKSLIVLEVQGKRQLHTLVF